MGNWQTTVQIRTVKISQLDRIMNLSKIFFYRSHLFIIFILRISIEITCRPLI